MISEAKFVNRFTRTKLGEGKQYGLGFAFCKKRGGTFTTLHATTTCKDYLNEVVVTENTGLPSAAYGFSWKEKTGIFEKPIYLAFNCQNTREGKGNNYRLGTITLDDYAKEINIEKILAGLNEIENSYGVKLTTGWKAESKDPLALSDTYILNIDPMWCTSTYMISLFTLTIRNLVHNETKHPNPDFIFENTLVIPQFEEDIERLKKTKGAVHNSGVYSLKMERLKHLVSTRSEPSPAIASTV